MRVLNLEQLAQLLENHRAGASARVREFSIGGNPSPSFVATNLREAARPRNAPINCWWNITGAVPLTSPRSALCNWTNGAASPQTIPAPAQLRTTLIAPLGLAADRCFGFRSDALDPAAECERIRMGLAGEGPIDLCILGLGINGHIAMNEPAASLRPFAHVAQLTGHSLRHPMLANSKTTPTHGLTLGLAEILASREILLLVSGASKRAPLERLLQRNLTTEFPASFLWLHPNCTALCDREAAAGLDVKA